MKLFYLPVAMVLLFSCSTDHDLQDTTTLLQQQAAQLRTGHPASNANNPYDYSGLLFDELFTAYYADANLPSSTTGIVARVNKVADENATFQGYMPFDYAAPTTSSTVASLSGGSISVGTFVGTSSLSVKGQTELATFINAVVPLANNSSDFENVYAYITGFETTTLNDPVLTSKDKEVMLTTSSISRFSAYRKGKKPKKKEDPEWDLLVTHVTAGASGAELNVCTATSRALVTGIAGQ